MEAVANARRWAALTMLLVLLLATGAGLARPGAAHADDPPPTGDQGKSEHTGGATGSAEGVFTPSEVRSPQAYTACTSPALDIPDNDPAGVTSQIVVADSHFIGDLNIYVSLSHTWVGDLVLTIEHVETGTSVTIIDRPPCSGDNIVASLDDEAVTPVEDECSDIPPAIQGAFIPSNPLFAFDGENLKGTWQLTVSDYAAQDTGTLYDWCIINTARAGYVVDSAGTDHLWMLDLDSGLLTEIGPVGFASVEALAFAPNGKLYGVDDDLDQLITIDLATGAGAAVGPLTTTVNDPGLAFDVLGRLWMVDDSTEFLYSVNPSSGRATAVGYLGQEVTGLAARGMKLFGLGGDNRNNLITINSATGAATLVGPLVNVTLQDGGLDFDAEGSLWGVGHTSGNPDTVFVIDPDTGSATFMGNTFGVTGVTNLAIPPAPMAYTVDSDDADHLWLLYLTAGIVIDVGPASYGDIAALAFSPDGTLYGIDDALDYLITLDLTTGAGTYAGYLDVNVDDPGLAFDMAGNLWMVDNGTQKLYSVAPGTGLATPIGSLSQKVTALTARGMTLYGLGGDGANNLVTINTATGAATSVGPLLDVSVSNGGLAFDVYGNLWGISDTNPDKVFAVNPATGEALEIAEVLGAHGYDNLAVLVAPLRIYLPLVLRAY